MINIWFTSDTHLGHKNIVKSISKWEDTSGCRDFNSLEEHDELIIENFNSLVKPNDLVYHLGDWSFGGHENILKYRNAINCKTIYLVLGNHDQHIEPINSQYRKLFASVSHQLEFALKIDSQKSGKYGKQGFFLSHYSHQVWNNHQHGTIHLFGHSHGSLQGIGRSMDVGLDTNNYYPYHLDEILFLLKDVKSHEIDHHNYKTT